MKIELSNIKKDFKNVNVLHDINYIFESGKIYGLSGRNGSGKTVLLKILCGLIKPTTGHITIDGTEVNINNVYKFNIGALIENPKFLPDLTGLENLKVLAEIKNEIDDEKIVEVLKKVNLYEEKDKKYNKYSLGMKQKLGIAQAIMEDQKIILLDEPFSGIEEISVKKIKEFLKEEVKKDKIIIISSHIREDILELANEILYFDNGTITRN